LIGHYPLPGLSEFDFVLRVVFPLNAAGRRDYIAGSKS